MRGHKLFLLIGLATSLASLSTRANDIEPGKEFYNVIYTPRPIVLDGNLSEWSGVPILSDPKFAVPKYSGTNANPNYVLFEQYSGGTWSGPDDQTSAVQIAFDTDNVYFGFVVTDDYHENISGNPWNGDSIQLMIADSTRTQQIALYNYALGGYEDTSGVLQTNDPSGASYGGTMIMHEAGPQCITDGTCLTEAVVTRNSATHKTTYEIRLPKEALGLTSLKNGASFGLGMAINDGDGALVNGVQYGQAGQEGQKGWGGLGAHSIVFGKTPSETALMTLQRLNDIEPSKEAYTAVKTTNTITIDGNLSEWAGVPILADPKFAVPKYSGTNDNPNYVLFEQYSGGTWSGPDDQTSAVQIAYDSDNVYFGFIVTDDYHENISGNPWNGDSVQLMIADAARTNQIALYNYALGGYEDASGVLQTNDPSGASYGGTMIMHEAGPQCITDGTCLTDALVTRNSGTHKTIYEIKLPAAAVGLTPPLTAGMQFGLGMAINDGDGALVNGTQYGQAGQEGQKGWGGLGAHSIVFGKTPSETALITLGTTASGGDLLFLSAVNPGIYSFTFRANDVGTSVVDPNNVKLVIDNQTVALTNSPKVNGATDFAFTPTSPFPPLSAHAYTITVKDALGNTVTSQGSFTTPNYSLDKLHNYLAEILNAAKITPDKGGHTGKAGDTALDFGPGPDPASALVPDATFLNPTASNDVMSASVWLKRYDNPPADGTAFWAESAASAGNRGFLANVPLSASDSIVFDVGGNGPDEELAAPISGFPGWTDDSFYTNWHNYIFIKNAGDKQIWIDGQFFADGPGATVVPTDFTKMWFGAAGGGQGGASFNLHGLIDDFAIFGSALTTNQIQQLGSGTAVPTDLPANAKLLAYWDFSAVAAVVTPTITIGKSGSAWKITFTGVLRSSSTANGTYNPVSGATSPYTIPAGSPTQFYRSSSN